MLLLLFFLQAFKSLSFLVRREGCFVMFNDPFNVKHTCRLIIFFRLSICVSIATCFPASCFHTVHHNSDFGVFTMCVPSMFLPSSLSLALSYSLSPSLSFSLSLPSAFSVHQSIYPSISCQLSIQSHADSVDDINVGDYLVPDTKAIAVRSSVFTFFLFLVLSSSSHAGKVSGNYQHKERTLSFLLFFSVLCV